MICVEAHLQIGAYETQDGRPDMDVLKAHTAEGPATAQSGTDQIAAGPSAVNLNARSTLGREAHCRTDSAPGLHIAEWSSRLRGRYHEIHSGC